MPKDSSESTVAKLDELQDVDADVTEKDQEFESLFRYKSVAAVLLKYAVPDFEKYSLQEIADSILDIRPCSPKRDADHSDKFIQKDKAFGMRFKMKFSDSDQIKYINVTANFEMQGHNILQNYCADGKYICEIYATCDFMEMVFDELKKLSEHRQDEFAHFIELISRMSRYGELMYAEGAAEFERKKAIEIAKNLIKLGLLTIAQIAQGLDLSEEDVLEAKKTIKE